MTGAHLQEKKKLLLRWFSIAQLYLTTFLQKFLLDKKSDDKNFAFT